MGNDSINPNVNLTETQTTEKGKIELNSSSGAVSFDELEQLERDSKKSKKAAKDEKKESVDLSSDDKKTAKSEKTEKSEDKKSESKKDDEQKQEAANKAAIEKARKIIKAKLNDSEIDLDEESLVPVKINGKEELVPVKDLMSNYSGKVAWDKRFTEQSKREKHISSLEAKANQAIQSFKTAIEEQDPTLRMFKMSQMAGVDPITYRQKFFDDNINLLEKWYAMSDDERKADALAYEAQYHKYRADTLERDTKQQQAQRELQHKLHSLRASHNISEEDYSSIEDQVKQAVSNKALDESYLQPEKIIETIQKDQLWKAVDMALQDLDLPWNEQERGENILKLVENSHSLGFKPEEMAAMVVEVWGQNKTKKKIDEIKKRNEEFLTGKQDVKQVAQKSSEPLFFDEIL